MNQFLVLFLALLACLPLGAQEPKRPSAIFLVAAKSLQDSNFRETVVLVTQHGGGGPIGVIVNRPTQTPVGTLFPDNRKLDAQNGKLHFGGPVAPQSLVFVFRSAAARDEAIELLDGVYMSLSATLLRELLQRDTPFRNLRVYAGYAGWAPGQLEHEIARGDWYLAEADAATLFDRNPDGIWSELLLRASARRIRSDRLPWESPPIPMADARVAPAFGPASIADTALTH